MSPSLDGSAIVNADELVVAWAPPHGDVPIMASLHVAVDGDWDYTLYCTGPDTGELAFPVELVEQVPLPSTARLHLRRAQMRLLDAGDGRFVLAEAETTTEGEILLQ